MPSPLTDTTGTAHAIDPALRAMDHLRSGVNPFAIQVAAVSTADGSISADVEGYASDQLAELLAIIDRFRTGQPPTQVFPLLGDRGAGKTHLFYSLRAELRRRAVGAGEETLLVTVERLAPGMDAIDYLLWQIVNHLLAQKGDGARMLEVIAGRATGRLLAESLRLLAPQQRVELIPSEGFLSKLGIGGRGAPAKLAAIDALVQHCEAKNPMAAQIRLACDKANVKPEAALALVVQHLEQTESRDVQGWLRKELYGRLARAALLNDRGPFDELHTGGYENAPAHVKNAGNIGRHLLRVWLELLAALSVPMVVVFDQLEDYLRSPDAEQQKLNARYFTGAAALFVNELPRVCVFLFAEEGFWTQLMTEAEQFTAERLTQSFALPGQPAKKRILMPGRVAGELLPDLARQRVRSQFPDLDFTGLPPSFPFDEADLSVFAREPSIRRCLRRMAVRYDEVVFGRPATGGRAADDGQSRLKDLLAEMWRREMALAEKAVAEKSGGHEMHFPTSFIPEVQNALQAWLDSLRQYGLTGAGPWSKVELISDIGKQQYGYLNVLRTNGPNSPGIGIAAWLGEARARPYDLRQRVGFFKANPCPIKTLVMLRADGEEALKGETLTEYEKARNAGRDVRVHKYEPRHLHGLLAFSPWLQAANAEVQAAKESDPNAEKVLRAFLTELSREWVGWTDRWRGPAPRAENGKGE